jgi:hypothetical protein
MQAHAYVAMRILTCTVADAALAPEGERQEEGEKNTHTQESVKKKKTSTDAGFLLFQIFVISDDKTTLHECIHPLTNALVVSAVEALLGKRKNSLTAPPFLFPTPAQILLARPRANATHRYWLL